LQSVDDIYRNDAHHSLSNRREIELFFKAFKQNLRVPTLVGTSENVPRIQIWAALIAILLLKWMRHLSKPKWSLSNLASTLRMNLFSTPT
jgi:IS4 transposase